ncbi:tRNA1(Val) (adenine(37)-N6)-methyltransferase [Marinobacterium lutimaris]|uniref:tRNA1Val (Adenine37-N6)-methyltransferase n=1 Tax=Marinobacterium lutimaris TaxID=568106 RepID=A0A1H5YGW9_9GAMM|nr:methyltransferase [Marinobacterium lutimaris]SEG23349.1 tRNA1Val (adenine37-N6)-methyltransferase [Marinobacterium lutimaris]
MNKRQRNSFFQCKEFRIEQRGAAMKVTTDACILGAWAPLQSARRILDIGTGSGVLSLFAAQRAPEALIDAVELDPEAAQQASDNFEASPFRARLNIHCTDIRRFQPSHAYDLVLCNPPFFDSSTPNANSRLSQARHSPSLPLADLLESISTLLEPNGKAFLLLERTQAERALSLIQSRPLFLRHQLNLNNQAGNRAHCVILGLSPEAGKTERRELNLYSQHPVHSREAGSLLYPFYTRLRCEDPKFEINQTQTAIGGGATFDALSQKPIA